MTLSPMSVASPETNVPATNRFPRPRSTVAANHTNTPEVALKPNFGSLISAINASAAHSEKIKAMTEVNAANVTLVNAEELLQGNSKEALEAALTKNEADIATLRTTLGANTGINGVITATTNATPLTAADIIATDVTPDGKVVLYYWKKSA